MARASPVIAGKPAPTLTTSHSSLGQYRWELACRRWGQDRQHRTSDHFFDGSPAYKDEVTALEHARQRGYREMEALLAR